MGSGEMKEKLAVEDVMVYPAGRVGWPWLWQRAADYAELAKLRLSLLVLFSALVGFFLGGQDAAPLGRLACFGCGLFLVIAGANALNQVIERDFDARMRRTANRPLPAERLGVGEALVLALLCSAAGLFLLTAMVNGLTGALGAVAWGVYIFVYTPMKRTSAWNTFFGAISGALPPVMGWAAAQNRLDPMAWVLFGILFLWQFPHFWAIAWMYRDEYAGAGYRMLPVSDPTGARTGRQAVLFSLALVALSLAPPLLQMETPAYTVGAAGLGLLLLAFSARLWAQRTSTAARHLLLASVLYLPALLVLMLAARK